MKLRNTVSSLVIIYLLLFSHAVAQRQEEQSSKAEKEKEVATQPAAPPDLSGLVISHYSGGYFSVGGSFGNANDSINRVAEYQAFRQGTRPTTRLGLWGYTAGLAYELKGERGVDPTDQQYRIQTDLKRYWKSDLYINKLPHRLLNDPLSNLDTGKGPVIVRHDSLDAGIEYCPYYRDLSWTNRILMPLKPRVEVRFGYRNQGREGSFQARTMSKCANCHVVSDIRPINQETEEFNVGLALSGRSARLEFDFVNRDFRESAAAPLNVFDEVQHPASQLRVFTNRIQFEASDGPLPFAEVPVFKKNQHRLRAWLELPRNLGSLSTTLIDGRSQNSSVGFGVDTRVISGRYSTFLGKRLSLSFQALNLDISGDTLFVDVIERPGDGGPQAGLTFPEAYPDFGEPDYFKRSSLERDQFDFVLNGRLRLPRRTLLRFGYDFEELTRPQAEQGRTQTHRLRVGFSSGLKGKLKTRARYVYSNVKDPFLNRHAALPPALQPFASPGNPPSPFAGTQYFEVYDARMADLTNFPRDTHEVTASTTWSPTQRLALTGHLRAKRLTNNDLNDFGNWEETEVSPSAELWLAPHDRFTLVASYGFHRRHTESLFGIAVYDG